MTASSVVVAVGSYRFLFLGIDGAFRESLGATAVEPQLYLAAHVIAAPVALLLGGFSFSHIRRAIRRCTAGSGGRMPLLCWWAVCPPW